MIGKIVLIISILMISACTINVHHEYRFENNNVDIQAELEYNNK